MKSSLAVLAAVYSCGSLALERLRSFWGTSAAKLLPALAVSMVLASCGGGGSDAPSIDTSTPASAVPVGTGTNPTPAGGNVLPITVDRGLDGSAINVPFVTVTVCQPGTTSCQTVDHVVVDTGSFGLRLAASALTALSLPTVANAAGVPVGECAQFAGGFTWGSVRRADVKLAGESAANIPIQVVDDPASAYATVPASCRRTGPNMGPGTGTKGILGVGFQVQDCGATCLSSTAPGIYFACPAGGCVATTLPLASQVINPVAALPSDNNGVVMVLPPVPAGGLASLSGSLIFGIDTQANNQLGSATVFQVNSQGNFTTTYKGVNYTSSFLDSGSNAIFFPDATIPVCSGFYCPATPLTLTAVNTSASGVAGTVTFTIENVLPLATTAVAANIGADIGLTRSFDWGLPFFFGRTVFVARAGGSTSKGPGPFWAY